MTDTPASSRRRFPRVQVSLNVDVRVESAGQKPRTIVGRLVVLGAGGAFLELDDVFPLGLFMHVRFELPGVGEISCRAMVRYGYEEIGVGVEFLDIGSADRNHIVAFVAKHKAWQPMVQIPLHSSGAVSRRATARSRPLVADAGSPRSSLDSGSPVLSAGPV